MGGAEQPSAVPIGFPPPRTPDFNVEVFSERPSEGRKASRDMESINVPVRDDGERTKPADPVSTLNPIPRFQC